jgi:hypothetical protein
MEENKNDEKREFKKVNDREGRPTEESVKEDSKRTLHDVILGVILIVASYGITVLVISMAQSWMILVFVALLIINGVLVVRGFRRKRVIISVFGLAFLTPVLFGMLALGACGLMFNGF